MEDVDYKDKFSLKEQVVIITGARGLIGSAFCEACAQFGAKVIVADLPGTGTIESAKSLEVRHACSMLGVDIDVSDINSVKRLKDLVLEKYGKIDSLVNCHQNKTNNFFAKFEEYNDEDWDAVIETNLKGTYLTCKIIGSWMAENGGGNIVNLGSTYAVVAPNQMLYEKTNMGCPAAYSASKGGIHALSQYLASYWAEKKVRVNLLTPHGVWNNHEKKFEENFSRLSPMNRMSFNHEVAAPLLFLLSNASSYVTGHNLCIDGGWTCW